MVAAPPAPVQASAIQPPTPVDQTPVLRCAGLKKRFGDRQAVDGVGFEIGPGETYGLLGPNGAGKTTTISMICGILARDGGEVAVAGEPLDIGTTRAKRLVGIVPQDLAIYPDLTARENLDYFGRLYGMRGAELKARIGEVLDVVELRERQGDRTAGYSGGMKRRLNIAIGLLHRPRLLVLDEPTVGLDPVLRRDLWDLFARLAAAGATLLVSSHVMDEAVRCDRLLLMRGGRLLADATLPELLERTGTADVEHAFLALVEGGAR